MDKFSYKKVLLKTGGTPKNKFVLVETNNVTDEVFVYNDQPNNSVNNIDQLTKGAPIGKWTVNSTDNPTAGEFIPFTGEVVPGTTKTFTELIDTENNNKTLIQNTGQLIDTLSEESKEGPVFSNYPGTTTTKNVDNSELLGNAFAATASAEANARQRFSPPTSQLSGSYGALRSYRYPLTLQPLTSDIVQFQIVKYKPLFNGLVSDTGEIKAAELANSIGTTNRGQTETIGSIALAIQPPVSDANTVNWTESGVNALQLGLAATSLGFIRDGVQGAGDVLRAIGGRIGADSDAVSGALSTYFAQLATQSSGLLTRLTGSILNPNLETLFQGPRTRGFTYTFFFTPRDEDESIMVRSIIRAFKEAMAVKRSTGNLFLSTPYVFNIKYLYQGEAGQDHPYIGKVKGPCALKSCTTDYTPQGNYMTYSGGSMVQYKLELQFQELDPVYADDYLTLGENSIGY